MAPVEAITVGASRLSSLRAVKVSFDEVSRSSTNQVCISFFRKVTAPLKSSLRAERRLLAVSATPAMGCGGWFLYTTFKVTTAVSEVSPAAFTT